MSSRREFIYRSTALVFVMIINASKFFFFETTIFERSFLQKFCTFFTINFYEFWQKIDETNEQLNLKKINATSRTWFIVFTKSAIVKFSCFSKKIFDIKNKNIKNLEKKNENNDEKKNKTKKRQQNVKKKLWKETQQKKWKNFFQHNVIVMRLRKKFYFFYTTSRHRHWFIFLN